MTGFDLDISVLISTHNRAHALAPTLEALRELDATGIAHEVIVIDNASTDHTSEVLQAESRHWPLKTMSVPQPGKNRALNAALPVARGALLAFIDDDILPRRDWLQQIQAVARRWPEDAIFGGRIEPLFPPETPPWIRQLEDGIARPTLGRMDLGPEGPVEIAPLGGNLVIRAELFTEFQYSEQIGPNSKSYAMGSETELLMRMKAAGRQFIYAPEVVVQHIIRADQIEMAWFLSRAYRFGRGAARLKPSRRLRIAGVPWPMWPMLGWTGLQYALTRPCQDARRFPFGWKHYVFRGLVHEYRQLRRELTG